MPLFPAFTPVVVNIKDSPYGAKGDGTTTDDPAIQAAINAVQAVGGGIVFLPEGMYNITAPLVVSHDNVAIIGTGFGSVLQVAYGYVSASPMLQYTGPTGTFRRGCYLANFSVNGQSVSACTTVIELDQTHHALIDHIEIHDCPGTNLYFNGADSVYGAYNTVQNCTFRDSRNGVGILLRNNEWCNIANCQFILFDLSGSIGIHCLGSLNNNINGCMFDSMDTGVYIDYANYCNITGSQFDEGNSQFVHIKAGQCNTVVGNIFNRRTGSGTDVIYVEMAGNNRQNVISGNSVQVSVGWTNFVHEDNGGGGNGGNGNTYANNDTGGTTFVLLTGTARGNRGYNPVGVLGPPVIPNSTVAYTNAYGVDCMVYVTGGTITTIAVAGHATGLTSGSFRVPAGSSITLTYTGSPTWTWFGD